MTNNTYKSNDGKNYATQTLAIQANGRYLAAQWAKERETKERKAKGKKLLASKEEIISNIVQSVLPEGLEGMAGLFTESILEMTVEQPAKSKKNNTVVESTTTALDAKDKRIKELEQQLKNSNSKPKAKGNNNKKSRDFKKVKPNKPAEKPAKVVATTKPAEKPAKEVKATKPAEVTQLSAIDMANNSVKSLELQLKQAKAKVKEAKKEATKKAKAEAKEAKEKAKKAETKAKAKA